MIRYVLIHVLGHLSMNLGSRRLVQYHHGVILTLIASLQHWVIILDYRSFLNLRQLGSSIFDMLNDNLTCLYHIGHCCIVDY